MSTNPKANEWKEAIHEFEPGGWDPDFFSDEDASCICITASSNTYPLYGAEIDPKTFHLKPIVKKCIFLQPFRYGCSVLANIWMIPF